MSDVSRRDVLVGAATLAATAVPLPVVVEKGVDLGVEYGPEKYFVCWWDKAELDAFARAFAPLAEER
jgi:hypothetical protein